MDNDIGIGWAAYLHKEIGLIIFIVSCYNPIYQKVPINKITTPSQADGYLKSNNRFWVFYYTKWKRSTEIVYINYKFSKSYVKSLKLRFLCIIYFAVLQNQCRQLQITEYIIFPSQVPLQGSNSGSL